MRYKSCCLTSQIRKHTQKYLVICSKSLTSYILVSKINLAWKSIRLLSRSKSWQRKPWRVTKFSSLFSSFHILTIQVFSDSVNQITACFCFIYYDMLCYKSGQYNPPKEHSFNYAHDHQCIKSQQDKEYQKGLPTIIKTYFEQFFQLCK